MSFTYIYINVYNSNMGRAQPVNAFHCARAGL